MKTLVKVCGLTRPDDARQSFLAGASFGGVIGYEGSPRFVSFDDVEPILAEIPRGKRVWVAVESSPEDLDRAFRAGFDFVQVHFDPAGSYDLAGSLQPFDRERVWLAPRLANLSGFEEGWTSLGSVSLIDGFSPDKMGGTGKRVDGLAFRELSKRLPNQRFSLAGGITPENVAEALRESGALQIDLSSGLEESPGIKDPSRVMDLFRAIQEFEAESEREGS